MTYTLIARCSRTGSFGIGMLEEFRPYVPFYHQRWREPAHATPQDAFVEALPRQD